MSAAIPATGNNGTLETSYGASIGNRMAVSSGNGMFRNGASTGGSHAAFDPSLDKINSYNQCSSAGGYTVRAGETLGSIAANLWGDSSLWYKLAQANGLSGEAALSEGQSLRIPAGVMKNTHNAATFKPYDPAEAIGDTSPTTPKPPKHNKCGAFGQVLLVVIAVAVAAIAAPYAAGALSHLAGGTVASTTAAGVTATGLTAHGAGMVSLAAAFSSSTTIAGIGTAASIAGGAIAGAASSIASQSVGVAFDIQQKFSWTAVASSALAGGLAGAGKLGVGGKGIGSNAARAMVSNVLSQGASIALGPQSKFSWAGVAAAGIGSAVGGAVSKYGPDPAYYAPLTDEYVGASLGNKIAATTASGIANAATRTAIDGGNFGDNLRAAIPDIIGQAIGEAFRHIARGEGNQREAAQAREVEAAVELATSLRPRSPTPDEIGEMLTSIQASSHAVRPNTPRSGFSSWGETGRRARPASGFPPGTTLRPTERGYRLELPSQFGLGVDIFEYDVVLGRSHEQYLALFDPYNPFLTSGLASAPDDYASARYGTKWIAASQAAVNDVYDSGKAPGYWPPDGYLPLEAREFEWMSLQELNPVAPLFGPKTFELVSAEPEYYPSDITRQRRNEIIQGAQRDSFSQTAFKLALDKRDRETSFGSGHHLVMLTAKYPSAILAREILDKFDINVNGALNGIGLVNHGVGNHRAAYANAVLIRLEDAPQTRVGIEVELARIGSELKALDLAGVRMPGYDTVKAWTKYNSVSKGN